MVVKAARDAAKAAVLGGRQAVTQSNLQRAIEELQKNQNSANAHG
jgi:hypothetical protein